MKKIILYSVLTFIFCHADTTQEVFTDIYRNNYWQNPQSVSGPGSTLEQTEALRFELPKLLQTLGIKTLLDAPCGDFNWMKEIDLTFLDSYIGADIVPELVESNQTRHSKPNITFKQLNIISDPLPQVDAILCRDCFIHLSFNDIFTAIANFKRSKSTYLLATTFTNAQNVFDIKTGGWHIINLTQYPFNFPEPLAIINEGFQGQYADKCLALWRIEDLPF